MHGYAVAKFPYEFLYELAMKTTPSISSMSSYANILEI
jgi:hypothetical protein